LVPHEIGEEGFVFEEGMGFGTLEGFGCPGVNNFCDSFVGDVGQGSLANCGFHTRGPLNKTGIVSMFGVKKGKGVIDN